MKITALSALLALAALAPNNAHADATKRYFSRVGKTAYLTQRCYCGMSAVVGKTTAKDGDLRIAALRCEDGLTLYRTGAPLGGSFDANLYVSNGCYRWMLIAPKGKVVDARVLRVMD